MRIVVIPVIVAFAGSSPAPAAEFKDISFLSGCWKTAPGVSPEYRECYTAPKAGMMQGSSQTISEGKTTSFEFSLVLERDGKVIYRPFPGGKQAAIDFTLTTLAPGEAIFENLAHDFPQRVIYRKADGKLTARIEDAAGKKFMQWVMQPQ